MTLWDKRARDFFLLLVAVYPWVWIFVPVCLKYYPVLFLLPLAYAWVRYDQQVKAEERLAREKREKRVHELREAMSDQGAVR